MASNSNPAIEINATDAPIYLDHETCGTFQTVQRVATQYGIPCIGVFGVSNVIHPEDPSSSSSSSSSGSSHVVNPSSATVPHQLMYYVRSYDAGDHKVIEWETFIKIIKEGNLEEFKRICSQDPDVINRVGIQSLGTRPIHVAAAYDTAFPILEWLLSRGDVDILVKSNTGKSPIDYAILRNNPKTVEALLRSGVSPKSINPEAFCPYIEGATIPEVALENIFRIMDLLPESINSWDNRWKKLYDMKHPTSRSHDLPRDISSAPAPAPAPAPQMCVICMTEIANTIAIPCCHKVVCQKCSALLKTDQRNHDLCIYCRQHIDGVYLDNENQMQS